MLLQSRLSLLARALVAVITFSNQVVSQYSGWRENQVSSTMCTWEALRAIHINDTVFLDGGDLRWATGLNDGSVGPLIADGNPLGIVCTLNLGKTFNTSSNITSILGTLIKGGATTAPTYVDGALLGNENKFYLYGGISKKSDVIQAPPADGTFSYSLTGIGKNIKSGFDSARLPANVTRYVSYGGSVNVPSENMSFYFGGLRSPSWGEIFQPINDGLRNLMAVEEARSFISLDLSRNGQEKWENATIPPLINSRANPELVWVPYGKQGLLVVIGGVTHPEYAFTVRQSDNAAAAESEGREFMKTIDVYDIATKTWYQQPTSGETPGTLARGCTVMAPAEDMSSVNIYWYGGYDGIHSREDFSDDVYVLSLPSFSWTKVYSGKPSHARAGHKCIHPYPDQMMIIGGYNANKGRGINCLEGSIVQVFNITSLEWVDKYDPAKYGKYEVHKSIYAKIGGNEKGGATMKTPSAWKTTELGAIFAQTYPTSKIATHYPYASVASENEPSQGGNSGENANAGGGTPGFVWPLVGSLLGILLIILLIVGILCFRRRKRRASNHENGVPETDENGNKIISWMRGHQSDGKEPTVTATEDVYSSPGLDMSTPVHPEGLQKLPPHSVISSTATTPPPLGHRHLDPPEMMDTQVAELMNTELRFELQDTGLTPVEIINKHSHFRQKLGGSALSSGIHSSVPHTDHVSTLSRTSGPSELGAGGPDYAATTRSDSPPPASIGYGVAGSVLGTEASQPPSRITSGVSGVSEFERRHLRHLSDETVSSMQTGTNTVSPIRGQFADLAETGADAGVPEPNLNSIISPASSGPNAPSGNHPLVGTPPQVSPPTAGDHGEPEDYMSVRPREQSNMIAMGLAGSPLRKSAFREHGVGEQS